MILAIANHKGGVGKTTTTVNLGAALARSGQRVLLIDLDGQCNLSTTFGLDPYNTTSIGLLMLGKLAPGQVIHRISAQLHLIPASYELAVHEIQMNTQMGRESFLRKALEGLGGDYDYVLLDCPPNLGILTANALVAADAYLVTMFAESYSYEALAKLQDAVANVQQYMNARLRLLGVLFTRHSDNARTLLGRSIEESVRRSLPVFGVSIRRNVALVECVHHRQHVFDYDPESNGAADYLQLAHEILSHEKERIL